MKVPGLLDLCLPEPCVICRMPICGDRTGGWPLCRRCFEALPSFQGSRCRVCGAELLSEIGICMRCRKKAVAFDSNVSLFPYRGAVRELIHSYKFEGSDRLAPWFARLLAALWLERFEPTPIIPVPPRRKHRGLIHRRDQVERIAVLLERRHAIPVRRLLVRRGGPAQKTLDYEGRMTNLAGKFSVVDEVPISGAFVLFDDVYTTGATANECSRVLIEAGASVVRVMTIALD